VKAKGERRVIMVGGDGIIRAGERESDEGRYFSCGNGENSGECDGYGSLVFFIIKLINTSVIVGVQCSRLQSSVPRCCS
jgi:hypothetical protein